jgi:hypothetical protein
MDGVEIGEPAEVPRVHGQNLLNTMDVHACGQPGIMDLHTLNVVSDQ